MCSSKLDQMKLPALNQSNEMQRGLLLIITALNVSLQPFKMYINYLLSNLPINYNMKLTFKTTMGRKSYFRCDQHLFNHLGIYIN